MKKPLSFTVRVRSRERVRSTKQGQDGSIRAKNDEKRKESRSVLLIEKGTTGEGRDYFDLTEGKNRSTITVVVMRGEHWAP